jgi:hypothetical protein
VEAYDKAYLKRDALDVAEGEEPPTQTRGKAVEDAAYATRVCILFK